MSNPLDRFANIPITLTVVIGSTRMPVADLLNLGRGDVLVLDRMVTEPIDLYANGTLVAHGEFAIVDGKMAITVTDITDK